jgi:acyl-CoA thioesterase
MSGSRSPQELAAACAAAMWNADSVAERLGMSLEAVGPGTATISMTVTAAMLNGHGSCHGGFIFTLADSAFAFAGNASNERSVAQHAAISFLVPVKAGDRLTAVAREVWRRGRGGLYDVQVKNQAGEQVAEFRGHARTIGGTLVPEQG